MMWFCAEPKHNFTNLAPLVHFNLTVNSYPRKTIWKALHFSLQREMRVTLQMCANKLCFCVPHKTQ